MLPFLNSCAGSTLTDNLLKVKVGFSLGTMIRHHRTSSSLLAKAGVFPRQQPLFLFNGKAASPLAALSL